MKWPALLGRKRKTLYVHIGIHRTGTTAIQGLLTTNRNTLLKAGVDYVDYALVGASHSALALSLPSCRDEMVAAMCGGATGPGNNMYHSYTGPDSKTLYLELGRYIRRSPCRDFIVSSECFYEWLDPKHVASALSGIPVDVRVLVSLRRQDRWIESIYSQVVKDPYLRYSRDVVDLPQWGLVDYQQIIGQWADAFGDDSICVGYYHEQEPVAELFQRFFCMIQQSELVSLLHMGDAGNRNASLDMDCTRVLALLNANKSINQQAAVSLTASMQELSNRFRAEGRFRPWRFSPEQSEELMREHREGNSSMIELTGMAPASNWGNIDDLVESSPEESKIGVIREVLGSRHGELNLDWDTLAQC